MLDRAEHACAPVGPHRGDRVRGHLLGVVGVEAHPQRRTALEPHIEHRSQHPGDVQAAQGASGIERLAAGLAGRGQVGRRIGGREIGERVELATLLDRHDERGYAFARARDPACLAGERAQAAGIGVVRSRHHHAAQVEPAQAAKDLCTGVAAREAVEEQLSHLALEREPPGEVGHAAGHRRALRPGLAGIRRRRHDASEEGDPLRRLCAARLG